jgi:acetyl esterase/lipase
MLRFFAVLAFLSTPLVAVAQAPKGPKLPAGVTTKANLAYGDHERNKLDLYRPKADKPLPLVIWVHGGAWEAGDKSGGNPALPLLAEGYAVAAVNYRFSKHAPFPAQIEDVRAAVASAAEDSATSTAFVTASTSC